MCGFFGSVGNFSEEFERSAIRAADRELFHRGPDFGSHVARGNGLLVARRLAIVDTSNSGHQPLPSQDGRHWLVFNGMLYNHRELRDELSGSYWFRGTSDTEVVAAALTRWGADALRRFEGMFALLWWDEVSGEMLAAVDQLGIKPLLYLTQPNGNLVCSSETGPLVDLFPQLTVDSDALGTYLSHGLIDHSERTLLRGVRQLRRGQYLTWARGKLEVKRYHEFLEPERASSLRATDLHDLLAASVARHLVADRPVGISLSSGLDSSILRVLAERQVGIGMTAITHAYHDHAADEASLIDVQRGARSTRHERVVISQDLVRALLPKLIASTLEPVGGLGNLGAYCSYGEAAALGFPVVLIGEGADEVFGGYPYYAETANARRISEADTRPLVRAPDGTSLGGSPLHQDFHYELVAPDLGTTSENAVGRSPLRATMWRDKVALKLPKLLRFQDRMSMQHGVEARLPFLDFPLVKASLSIRDEDLVQGSTTKVMLREVARQLGITSYARPKLSVPAPQREWIKGDLGEWIAEMANESLLVEKGVIDGPAFSRELETYRKSPEPGNSFFAWQFMTVELWCRALRERQTKASSGARSSWRLLRRLAN